MGIFNADVIINIPPAFFSLQKSGLVRVYLTSVSFFFLFLDVSVTKSLNLIFLSTSTKRGSRCRMKGSQQKCWIF